MFAFQDGKLILSETFLIVDSNLNLDFLEDGEYGFYSILFCTFIELNFCQTDS